MKLICPCCEEQAAKLNNPFTDKVWNFLLEIEEVTADLCGVPICQTCFQEFRSILIDHPPIED